MNQLSIIPTVAKIVALNPVKPKSPRNYLEKLIISEKSKLLFIDFDDILFCQSEGNYSHIHLKNGKKHCTSENLKKIENRIFSPFFVRIHNSYLINIKCISAIDRSDRLEVYLNSGHAIPISRSKKDFYKTFINQLNK